MACHQIYHIKAFEVCLMGRARMKGRRRKWMNWKSNILHGEKKSLKAFTRGKSDKNKGAFRKLNRDAIAGFYELDFLPASCPRFILFYFFVCAFFWDFSRSFQLPCDQGKEMSPKIIHFIFVITRATSCRFVLLFFFLLSENIPFDLKAMWKAMEKSINFLSISISLFDDSDTWESKSQHLIVKREPTTSIHHFSLEIELL